MQKTLFGSTSSISESALRVAALCSALRLRDSFAGGKLVGVRSLKDELGEVGRAAGPGFAVDDEASAVTTESTGGKAAGSCCPVQGGTLVLSVLTGSLMLVSLVRPKRWMFFRVRTYPKVDDEA